MAKRSLLFLFMLTVLFMVLVAISAGITPFTSSAVAAKSASGDPDSPWTDPQWGLDILVDPLPADNHENFSLAINPTNPSTILGSYKYEDAQGPGSGYNLSTDAGRTWSGARFSGPWGTNLMSPAGNTSVGYNAQGVAFYSSRAVSETANGLFVLTSTNGTAWGQPISVITSTNAELRNQMHLALDRRATGPNAGSVYLLWRWYAGENRGIWTSYSRDSARTWNANVQISDAANQNASGPSIATASNGTVYAAFQQLDNDCPCSTPRFFLDRSTDWGATWGTDRLITGAPITKTGALDKEGHDLVILGNNLNPEGAVEVNNYPFIAVAPNAPNTVYVVWNDGRWDTSFTTIYGHEGQHGDIAFTRTTDGGTSWSAPVRINDDPIANGVDQFMPAVATKADGTIGIIWFDRRVEPNHFLYDLFYSQSTDGGVTWSANQRVSDVSSDPMIGANLKGVGDLGEYKALVLGPDYVVPSWLDTRSRETQDFYSDRGAVSAPCALSFSDVHPSDYFYTAVMYLACHGVISGYQDGSFRPFNNTTRAQLCKIIVLAEGWQLECPTPGHFSDVPPDNTFYCYIETAYTRGIISGYQDGTFRWGSNVTRGQLCKIIVLAEGWQVECPQNGHFSDVLPGDTFYCYIETAYAHNVISGYSDGTFRPGNSATRGQICKIVYQAITAQ